MSKQDKQELRTYKKEAITAATELCYPDAVLDRIRNATSEVEVINILHDAREAS